MTTSEPTPFQRLFPVAEFFRNGTLRACLWSAVGTVLLACLLLNLCLVVDLLVDHEPVQVFGEDVLLVDHWLGLSIPEHEALVELGESVSAVHRGRGILPMVWRDRHRAWGPLLRWSFRTFPMLRHDSEALTLLISVSAAVSLLLIMCESRSRVLHRRVAWELSTRLRRAIHRQTLRLGPADLQEAGKDATLELFTVEVDRLRDGVYLWTKRVGRDVLQCTLLVLMGTAAHPILALQCLIPLAGCWYIAQRERQRAEEFRRLSQSYSDREIRLLGESLEKTRLVRGFGMEAFEMEQFQKYLQRFQDATAQTTSATAWSRRGVRVLTLACLAFALYLVGNHVLHSPETLPFSLALLMVVTCATAWFPLRRLSELAEEHATTELSALRIQNYLSRIPEVGQAVGAKFLHPLSRVLEFDNVCYAQEGESPLLDHVNVKIAAGSQVAIVASNPLEALAFAYMLPRFIEPQSGRILFDEEDIAWVTLESLRAETIFIGGKDPFLSGTIRENITGGDVNYSTQEVTEAAKLTHAQNFIMKLPQGLETVIGEQGEQLDAGQGFRLSLARAVLRKPAILIVEEPTATLDDDTKTLLDDAYQRLVQGRTVLFIPNRLSTIRRSDQVIFLHKGRVEAVGTHARLIEKSPLYRHWEYVRFNEFRREFESQ